MKANKTEPKRWSLRIKLGKTQSRATAWREKLKEEDPERYAQLQHKDKERKKQERKRLSEDKSREARMKQKANRQQTAFRVQQLRLRRKKAKEQKQQAQVESAKESDTPSTSSDTLGPKEKGNKAPSDKTYRREYMRRYMRERRLNTSRQKKQSEKRKDRNRKCRTQGSNHDDIPFEEPPATSTPNICSRQAQHKLKKTVQSKLPTSPSKFAGVMVSLTKEATPRKKIAMKKLGLTSNQKDQKLQEAVVQSIRSTMSQLGKKQSKGARAARNAIYLTRFHFLKKYRLTYYASSFLKMNRKSTAKKSTLLQLPSKAPSRKLPQETVNDVQKFYLDSSTDRPEKKFKGRKLMSASLRRTYKKYTKAKHKPVSWSTFRKLRPSTVCKLAKSHLFVCQCPYCVNIQFKLNTLNMKLSSCTNRSTSAEQNKWVNELKLNDVTELVNVLMCKKLARYHQAACINDTCLSCKDKRDKIKRHYAKLLECSGDEKTTWKRWERQKVTQKKKVTEGGLSTYTDQGVIRRVLIYKSGTINEMCDELIEDTLRPVLGVNICQHLFTAQWQNDQYRNLKENLDANTVLMVLDFGENVTTKFQDEIKSAHYVKKQITVHPIVTYYKEGSDIVRDAMIMLCDNLQHDHNAVQTFVETANQYLTNDRKLSILREIHFTDGATSQYKCASSFTDISYAVQDFKFPIQRCFYGSEHGKGESDGETGALKARLDEAVRGQGIVINNAKDLYTWASAEMTDVTQPGPTSIHTNSRRTFFLIEKEIPRSRERTKQMATLPQTRKVHSIRSTGSPYQVQTRNLSCFCKECLTDNETCCTNIEYVSQWKTHQLSKKTRKTMQNMKETEENATKGKANSSEVQVTEEASGTNLKECLPPQDPASVQEQTSLKRYGWVAVIYDDIWWSGVIQSVKQESYVINFMKPVGVNKFIWPVKVDSSEVKKSGILTSISEPPIPATSRYYSFHPNVASAISSKMIKYFKNL